jgi:hypothetical protein
MSTTAEGLGFIYDIGTCWSPVDLNTANGATGKRISLLPGRGVDIVREHTAYTSGTSADLVKIDHYYLKSETALDNDEGWSILEQTASATITEAGAAGTSAEHEQMIVIPVYASQLTEGYTHVSLNAAATVGNAQLAAAFYIVHGLRYRRRPDRLFNLLRPGVANA